MYLRALALIAALVAAHWVCRAWNGAPVSSAALAAPQLPSIPKERTTAFGAPAGASAAEQPARSDRAGLTAVRLRSGQFLADPALRAEAGP